MNKKNIFIVLMIVLFTTGCNCEYNLMIEEENYHEEIKIIAENSTELSQFNSEWKIPTDKEEYSMEGDPESIPEYSNLYDYKLVNNILTFSHDFTDNKYKNSSAVSVCYNKFKVSLKEDNIIISTRTKAKCYENYPQLNNITINVKVDKEVINHNADEVKGNIYTWYINKSNVDDKSINITLSNKNDEELDNDNNEQNSQNYISKSNQSTSNNINNNNQSTSNINNNQNNDYTMYIFLGILLIVMLSVYFIFNKIKNKNNEMDD